MEDRFDRPDWYIKTIRRLYQYPLDKKRLVILQMRIDSLFPKETATYSLAPAFSGPSDQTGKIATARAEVNMEAGELNLRIKEVEVAIESLNYESRRLIEMRYFESGNTDFWVYHEMHMSQATYYRLRNRLIKSIAMILGD